MKTYTATFVVAGVTSAALTPLARRLGIRLGALSVPGGRHVHRKEVSRIGGVAICIAFFVPLAALFLVESSVAVIFCRDAPHALGLMIGGFAMCLTGLVDDTKGLRAKYKLAIQVLVAGSAFAFGYRINAVSLPWIGELQMGVFALPVTVLWFVGVINAVNLIDGLDGLAGGVVFFAGLTNFVVAWITGGLLVALFMAAMLGAVLGFLLFNFAPARIFMGDSGSYFLGFVLAASALLGASQKASTTVSLLVPMVALGVPIFDTMLAMVRRFLERRSIFSPDRGHIHHRLLDLGLTQRRAVLLIYSVCVVLAAAAILISLGKSWQVGAALILASSVLIALIRWLGFFEYLQIQRQQKARVRDHETETLRRLLPRVLAELMAAGNANDAGSVLQRLANEAQLQIELVGANNDIDQQWTHGNNDGPRRQIEVSARFPLGNKGCSLRFRWQSESDGVSPQMDVLLQLVTDVAQIALAEKAEAVATAAASS